jgi:hypothetical protein
MDSPSTMRSVRRPVGFKGGDMVSGDKHRPSRLSGEVGDMIDSTDIMDRFEA